MIGNTLYQFSGAYGSAYLSKYSLPLSSSPTLPSSQLELANQIQGIPAVFNQKDNIALVLVSRCILSFSLPFILTYTYSYSYSFFSFSFFDNEIDLTLINLTTLTSQSNILAVSGSGKFPSCIVYNQKNNKVYYFQTNYCFAGYCQHIYEFKVNQNTGQLSYLDETFSPNFTSSFNDGELSGCGLDLNDNIIWCLHAKSERLYKFPISNINGYTSFKLPPGPYTNGNIAFNFNANKAYLTINKLNSLLREINLNNGVQSKSGSFRSGPDVASLNVVDGGQTLLVGFKFKGTRRMASINLNTFDDKYTNLHP